MKFNLIVNIGGAIDSTTEDHHQRYFTYYGKCARYKNIDYYLPSLWSNYYLRCRYIYLECHPEEAAFVEFLVKNHHKLKAFKLNGSTEIFQRWITHDDVQVGERFCLLFVYNNNYYTIDLMDIIAEITIQFLKQCKKSKAAIEKQLMDHEADRDKNSLTTR